jgi:dephospho-CoA kinase
MAKEIYKKDQSVLLLLKKAFGQDIFDQNGEILYERLARVIFSSHGNLKKINRIMFPRIRKEVSRAVSNNKNQDYVIIDAAVLFDARLDLLCDYIIWVDTGEKVRENFLKNKNLSDNEIKLKIKGQFINIDQKKVDYRVINSGTEEMLFKKASEIISSIEEAGQRK